MSKGQLSEATELAEKVAVMKRSAQWVAHVGLMYGLAGRRDDASRILAELTDLANRTYVSPLAFATVHMGMGDVENWRTMAQASLEERNSLLVFLNAPWNDSVRNDPFFDELRRKVGLPEPRA